VKLKVSILISVSCPGAQSRCRGFETMASISSRLSLGTTTSRDCAGVTTPPTVWIASCCHHARPPGRRAAESLVFCSALIRSWVEPVRLLLGLGELVGERAPIFGHCLAARLANRGHGRLRREQMALLNAEFLLCSTSSWRVSK